MFETATLADGPAGNRLWTTGLGIAGECVVVGCLILMPMLWPESLPNLQAMMGTLIAPVPPPPPPKGVVVKPRAHREAVMLDASRLTAPTIIPRVTNIFDDPPEAAAGAVGGVSDGKTGGLDGGPLSDLFAIRAALPPVHPAEPPVEAVKPKPELQRIRVGSGIISAKLIHKVEPEYPVLARQMHVSGTVELAGVIGTDGRIRELKAISGHPLLVKAALDAVRQWIYEPTLLNRVAVEVMAPITVTFRLN